MVISVLLQRARIDVLAPMSELGWLPWSWLVDTGTDQRGRKEMERRNVCGCTWLTGSYEVLYHSTVEKWDVSSSRGIMSWLIVRNYPSPDGVYHVYSPVYAMYYDVMWCDAMFPPKIRREGNNRKKWEVWKVTGIAPLVCTCPRVSLLQRVPRVFAYLVVISRCQELLRRKNRERRVWSDDDRFVGCCVG